MPSLRESLEGKELGYLSLVGELWGIEPTWGSKKEGAHSLSKTILEAGEFEGIFSALGKEGQAALRLVKSKGGKLSWSQFERQFGDIRSLGPAKLEKLKAHLHPQSTSEALWFRGLISRAFFESESGPREYAYIPDEFQDLISAYSPAQPKTLGRIARPEEYRFKENAGASLLSEMTSFLAARRAGLDIDQIAELEKWNVSSKLLEAFLKVAGTIDEEGNLIVKGIETFLTAEDGSISNELFEAWQASEDFSELHLLPDLEAQGAWKNSPRVARESVLAALWRSGNDRWADLDSFIEDFKEVNPDFMRSGGDYDAWFLKDVNEARFLKGYESWDEVEGRVIRYMVEGPLFASGFLELGRLSKGAPVSAFRLSKRGKDLFEKKSVAKRKKIETISVDSQGNIRIAKIFSRSIRYQISRFCEWQGLKREAYSYQITAKSLRRAKEQGIKASQLVPILEKYADSATPPSLLKAIRNWEQEGSAAKAGKMTVLRLRSNKLLDQLLNSRAKRYLGVRLGDHAIEVKSEALGNVQKALVEMGFFGDFQIEEDDD